MGKPLENHWKYVASQPDYCNLFLWICVGDFDGISLGYLGDRWDRIMRIYGEYLMIS
jgi:hypothetical protein